MSTNQISNDLEAWARSKLALWASDVFARFATVDRENDAASVISVLAMEMAAHAIAGTAMPPERGGELLAEAIREVREGETFQNFMRAQSTAH